MYQRGGHAFAFKKAPFFRFCVQYSLWGPQRGVFVGFGNLSLTRPGLFWSFFSVWNGKNWKNQMGENCAPHFARWEGSKIINFYVFTMVLKKFSRYSVENVVFWVKFWRIFEDFWNFSILFGKMIKIMTPSIEISVKMERELMPSFWWSWNWAVIDKLVLSFEKKARACVASGGATVWCWSSFPSTLLFSFVWRSAVWINKAHNVLRLISECFQFFLNPLLP